MDTVRQIGKYVTLGTCIVAIANGIIHKTLVAPIGISVMCWIGLVIWIVGFIGVRIQKRRASRSSGGMRAK
jgi:type IV secretory pathway TrbD component